jgi:hypothetical protein
MMPLNAQLTIARSRRQNDTNVSIEVNNPPNAARKKVVAPSIVDDWKPEE